MIKCKLTALFLLLAFVAKSQTKNFLDQPYMEVTGFADTLVAPDEIFIKIMISEKDTKDRVSVEETEQRMYTALKNLGLDVDKNLTTNDMASNFKFYLLKSKDILKSKQYILKVNDAVTASKVFIELEEIDIANVSIEKVSRSDMELIRNGMRSKAVENARIRAAALVKPLNQTVGSAIYVADREVYNPMRESNTLAEVVIAGYNAKNKNMDALPNIQFDKISVTTNVDVKFILKP